MHTSVPVMGRCEDVCREAGQYMHEINSPGTVSLLFLRQHLSLCWNSPSKLGWLAGRPGDQPGSASAAVRGGHRSGVVAFARQDFTARAASLASLLLLKNIPRYFLQ